MFLKGNKKNPSKNLSIDIVMLTIKMEDGCFKITLEDDPYSKNRAPF